MTIYSRCVLRVHWPCILAVTVYSTCVREQCIRSKGVAGGRKDRGLYDGRYVSGARMWLEVGETED